MKPEQIKQLFYTALLLFLIPWFFAGCKGEWLSPSEIAPITPTSGGGTTAVDTLPSFNSPTGLAIDASGNIYVADWGNDLIREITPAGVVSTFAGSGFAGYNDGLGALASFTMPTGLTIDGSGNLFVADAGNNLIREISSAGQVTTIAGSDTTGFANGLDTAAVFFNPLGVAVDKADNVYVGDAGNDMIRLVSQGGNVTTFAGFLNDGTSTTLSPFNNPAGVALDGLGNLFVANYLSNTILEVNSAGTVTTYAGTGQAGFNNGPVNTATFSYPNSVIVDAAENLYVSDGVNNVIRKITPGGVVSTFAGSGLAGSVDSTGTAASFNGPSGLAFDASGNLYVADTNNNLIRQITPAGVVTTVAGNGLQGSQNGMVAARRVKRVLKITPKLTAKSKLDLIFRARRFRKI